MPFDSARYEVEIGGVDRTGAAFASVEARLRSFQSTTRSMGVGQALGRDFDGLIGTLGRFVPALTAGAAAWKIFSAGMAAADLGEQAQQLRPATGTATGPPRRPPAPCSSRRAARSRTWRRC